MFLRKLLVIVVPLVLCGLCVFFLPLLGGFGLWSDLLQGLILGALLALLLGTRKAEFTPVMDIAPVRGRTILALAFYGAYLFIPKVLHIKEALQWHISRSRI